MVVLEQIAPGKLAGVSCCGTAVGPVCVPAAVVCGFCADVATIKAQREATQHGGDDPASVTLGQQQLGSIAFGLADRAAAGFNFIDHNPGFGVRNHSHRDFSEFGDGYARQGCGDLCRNHHARFALMRAATAAALAVAVLIATLAWGGRGFAQRLSIAAFGCGMSMLGAVSFPAAVARPTGEAGRPVKRASRSSLLTSRAADLIWSPASFRGVEFKRAAGEAVARLVPVFAAVGRKTGAGLPARTAFYCMDRGVA